MGAALWGDIALISLGAALGANLRYGVNRLALKYLSASVPYGTLLVNVSGSFILGFFLAWTTERVLADPQWRALVAVGFCGAYTTYSSYGSRRWRCSSRDTTAWRRRIFSRITF